MGSRPIYTIDQLIDIYDLEIYMIRPKDFRLVRGSWVVYLGWDNDTKKITRLQCSAKKYKTKTDAYKHLEKRIEEYNKGQIPHKMTFKDFAEKWLNMATCRESTKYNYAKTLEKHLIPRFGDTKLVKFTPSAIKQYLVEKQAERKKDGSPMLSPVTINEHLVLLRSMFRVAYHDGLMAKNPAAAIKRIPQVKAKADAFRSDEVKKILDTAKIHFPKWYVPIYHAFLTGERAGEIWAHRWSDLSKGQIKVERSVRNGVVAATKDKEIRFVDMPDELRRALNDASAYHSRLKSELLYTNDKGGHVNQRNFMIRVWYPLLKKANVRKLKFHCTRHTFASLHLKHGTSLGWISKQLGHSKLELTFSTYVHFMPDADAGAADKLAEVIG